MTAESEDRAIAVLKEAAYWDDPNAWRDYGDNENNFSTIGNQQSRPESALVEKLVNSVDARLMGECLARGIDPESDAAPPSIREAVALFFDGEDIQNNPEAGLVRHWANKKRTAVARGITLAATGQLPKSGYPCFVIADCGEGQTPNRMPETLLSLNKSNKLRIPFVQGKFNMGGTGVLRFCGKHNLQLILSRRNPAIRTTQEKSDATADEWGFTVVRRVDPTGGLRSSVYKFLAPLGGRVLKFQEDSMPIFPHKQDPYAQRAEHGTLIKLYDYKIPNRSNIILTDGLMSRVELLLPDLALPVRFHECRSYRGHEGSFDTTVTGLGVRLRDGSSNLEDGFPIHCPLTAAGEKMTATIYAFRKDKSEAYRRDEGIIFTINGQTHGHITADFFRRNKVGLSYLHDSLLVIVDCSSFSGRAREDLFINSRDRLSKGELYKAIEAELEDLLHGQTTLKQLKERRRREELESRIADERPLQEILGNIFKSSPTLSALFGHGNALVAPEKPVAVEEEEAAEYEGEYFPTYFRIRGMGDGEALTRECRLNTRPRIEFETDAANDYFKRETDKGKSELYFVENLLPTPVENYNLSLHNGIASLSIRLPENAAAGDLLHYILVVTDANPSRVSGFQNMVYMTVKPPIKEESGSSTRRSPPGEKKGDERMVPGGIALPNVVWVSKDEWESRRFTANTALSVVNIGDGEGYDFYLNEANAYLENEIRHSPKDVDIIKAKFKYGMVLIGLAILHDRTYASRITKVDGMEMFDEEDSQTREESAEKEVERTTRAIAPVFLPLISALGCLEIDDVVAGRG